MSWQAAQASAAGNASARGFPDPATARPSRGAAPSVASESEAAQALEAYRNAGGDAPVESRELDAVRSRPRRRRAAEFLRAPRLTLEAWDPPQALGFIARTGCVPREDWPPAKAYLGSKLRKVCTAFSASYGDDRPRGSGVSSLDELVSRLVSRLEGFDAPPFTIQRLSELLLRPSEQYRSTRKLLFALRRLLSVEMTTEDERELEPTSLAPPFSHHLAMPATFLGHEVLREVPTVKLKPSALQRQGPGAAEEEAAQGAHSSTATAAGTGSGAGAASEANGSGSGIGSGGAPAHAASASGPSASMSTAAQSILKDDAAQWPSGANLEGPPSELSPRKTGRARGRGMDEEDEEDDDLQATAGAQAAESQAEQAHRECAASDAASKPQAAQVLAAAVVDSTIASAEPAALEGGPTNGR